MGLFSKFEASMKAAVNAAVAAAMRGRARIPGMGGNGDDIDARMQLAGEAIVAKAQALAPVDTGALRDSITYVIAGGSRPVLSIQVGMNYGIYQEFGTRNIHPHPFVRPAINAVKVRGFDVEMSWRGTPGHAGLLAGTGAGHRRAGFAASASPGWRPLSAKQLAHVETSLIPSIKSHHRGNVKRSKMYVS